MTGVSEGHSDQSVSKVSVTEGSVSLPVAVFRAGVYDSLTFFLILNDFRQDVRPDRRP